MKVAVSSTAPGLQAQLSPIFGRCQCFVIVDTATQEVTTLENPALSASGGAGVQSAQYLVQQGVEAVISGNMGPNATSVFAAAGVDVYAAAGATVAQAITALETGTLSPLHGPSVNKDFGKAGMMGGRRGRGL